MIGCTTKITHLSPDELDTSRLPALVLNGADIVNPAIFYQTIGLCDAGEVPPWVLTLPCGTEYLRESSATAEDYTMIGEASLVVIQMRNEYVPLALVEAFHLFLSTGRTLWLAFQSAFTLTQRPLMYTLYRLYEMPVNEYSYLTIKRIPYEDLAKVFVVPNGDPQQVGETENCL